MELLLTGILAAAAITAIVIRRAHRLEALTILIVALPIVLWVPPSAPRWYSQIRRDHNRDADTARAITPLVISPFRSIPLEQQALASVALGETYAVVPRGHWIGPRDRGPLTYLESWLQCWLAPRLQVDPEHADWLILLDNGNDPLPELVSTAFRIGDDVLVRR